MVTSSLLQALERDLGAAWMPELSSGFLCNPGLEHFADVHLVNRVVSGRNTFKGLGYDLL